MHVYNIPEDILYELSYFLKWRDVINFCIMNKSMYSFIIKFDVLNASIIATESTLIQKALECGFGPPEPSENYFICSLKRIYQREIYNSISKDWVTLKKMGDRFCQRYYFMNKVLNEELRVWSPFIFTSNFSKTNENWIANCHTHTSTRNWGSWDTREDFKANSPECNEFANLIQEMTIMIRDNMTHVGSVLVIGAPYSQWDATPPTPLRALKKICIYAKRCKTNGILGQKRDCFRNIKWQENLIHIPTEYIGKNIKDKKSFHALQCMKLARGKKAKVRCGFSVYRNPKQNWEWYLRVTFDKIKIYV